jgi:sulfite reductase beta subunit-like hemoprotein
MVTSQNNKIPEMKPGFMLRTDLDEIDEFEERAKRFRIGDEEPTTFQLYRLSRGTYGQRQENNQMMRIKLPGGVVTADQLDALGEATDKYSGLRRGHITTRECFQLHFVNLDDAAEVMRILARAGLTTREACAHTVRNITSCPYAGITPDELFDTTPYLAAYGRTMLRNPISQRLPRKFKTAFSNCPDDCAGTNFHDIGFIARIQNGVRGFEIRVGGGTSTMPRIADTVWEFAEADNGEYIRVSEGIVRIFDREGDLPGLLRKNLNKARIKFLLHKIGVDAFKEKLREELAKDWAKEPYDMAALTSLLPEEGGPVVPDDGKGTAPGYERWRWTNVKKQKQDGFYSADVTIPMGNINVEQFHQLANILRKYSNGYARTNPQQNIVFRWVHEANLPMLHRELTAIGFGTAEAGLLADVVACPGADSCKLAITSSNQAGYQMREEMIKFDYKDPEVLKVNVKISGCPNGCGQHHMAGIGLQGSSYKVGKLEVPCYDVFVGGEGYQGLNAYATRVTRVSAKKAHLAIDKIFSVYTAERTADTESFADYVKRVTPKRFEEPLEEFKWVGSLAEDPAMYMDWGHDDMFEVIRGEGECAAGEVPLIR